MRKLDGKVRQIVSGCKSAAICWDDFRSLAMFCEPVEPFSPQIS